jgi:AraC family transcriptional activator of pobA
MTNAPPESVPRYFLYGEALDEVELAFLHVETIERRSQPNDWMIRAHAHPEHHQILILTEGGGVLQLDDHAIGFEAPAVVVVCALAVHAFQFRPKSDGYVLTVSTAFLTLAIEGDESLATLFTGSGCCLQHGVSEVAGLVGAFQSLEREFIWSAPGRRLAIKAYLQQILVMVARLRVAVAFDDPGFRRGHTDIVVRYRELIEAEFRQQPGLSVFARRLGVTAARLNTACRSVAGKSALAMVHDRIIIEAKRNLLYTGMTVGEIAASLGFSDAPYFNRFFTKLTRQTPGAFRAAASARRSAEAP